MISRITNSEVAVLGGVFAGIAYRTGIPVWYIRSVFIISLLFTSSFSFLIYLALWFIMPAQNLSKEAFELGIDKFSISKSINEKED